MNCFILLLFATFLRAATPNWVDNPSKGCRGNEMCAVGEGPSRTMAEGAAKANIAKVFKSRIKSQFASNLAEIDKEVTSSASESIEEIVDEEIEGIQVREVFESDTGFYALAFLNKTKYGQSINDKITTLDAELETEFEAADLASVIRAEALAIRREALSARLQVLSGIPNHPKVALREILNKKKSLIGGTSVYYESKGDSVIDEIVRGQLGELGYQFATNKSKYTTRVVFDVTSEESYLKVKGFRKEKFNFLLKSFDAGGVQIGSLAFDTIETGRNKEHAKDQAYLKFKEYLKENISKLRIK